MCPVCLLRPADTSEDILPDWARQRIRKLGTFKGGQVPSIRMPMCSTCNGAFNKLYENETAPIMGPMIDGEHRELLPAEQEIVGRWIIKSDLLLALGHAYLTVQEHEVLRRICLDMSVSKRPPHQSFVRLGGFDRMRPVDAPGHPDLHSVGPLPATLSWGATQLGWVSWEIAIGDSRVMEPFVSSCSDNESLVRVWPPQMAAISWPPSQGLVLRDIYTLRAAWQERVWPPPAAARIPVDVGSHKRGIIVAPHPSPDEPQGAYG